MTTQNVSVGYGGSQDIQDVAEVWNTTGQLTYDRVVETPREAIIAHNLNLYIPPVLIVVGSVGNSLAFASLSRRHLQQESVCFYLGVLSVAHTVSLYLSCGLEWGSAISGRPHPATIQDCLCKLWDFSKKVFESASSWLLAAMVIDRFLATCFPLQARSVCTVFIAKFINSLIFVGMVAINIHSMWTFEVVPMPHGKTCSLSNTHHDFETDAWPYIAATFSYYLPTLTIAAMSCVILCSPLCVSSQTDDTDEFQRRLSWITLALSLLFLLWSVPSIVHNFLPYVMPTTWMYVNYLPWRLAHVILQLCKYFYYSVASLVCFAALPSLRAETVSMLCKLCRENTGSTEHESLHSVSENHRPLLYREDSKYGRPSTTSYV